jgi:nucleotide-binding universal stress UspA family protein
MLVSKRGLKKMRLHQWRKGSRIHHRGVAALTRVADRGGLMKPNQRILFATDFSQASEKAFEQAMEIAKERNAELLIAHAYQPPAVVPTDTYLSVAMYEELDTKLRDAASQQIERFVRTARSRGVSAKPILLVGAPYEAIAEAAKELDAGLIVMGTHGRTGPARFFLGSVASRVTTLAPCPVLTVRAA